MKTYTAYTESYESMHVRMVEADSPEEAAMRFAEGRGASGEILVHEGLPTRVVVEKRNQYVVTKSEHISLP